MAEIAAQPPVANRRGPLEVVIDRVKFLRNAEAEGRYAETVAALNSH